MIRTIVSLEEDQKRWLERTARREGVPASRLIRKAVDQFRRNRDALAMTWEQLIDATAGIWKRSKLSSVERVRRMRSEWDHRPG